MTYLDQIPVWPIWSAVALMAVLLVLFLWVTRPFK